nr:hypothetical protein Iba_chr10fCG5660 [Ipomoea batatas]
MFHPNLVASTRYPAEELSSTALPMPPSTLAPSISPSPPRTPSALAPTSGLPPHPDSERDTKATKRDGSNVSTAEYRISSQSSRLHTTCRPLLQSPASPPPSPINGERQIGDQIGANTNGSRGVGSGSGKKQRCEQASFSSVLVVAVEALLIDDGNGVSAMEFRRRWLASPVSGLGLLIWLSSLVLLSLHLIQK